MKRVSQLFNGINHSRRRTIDGVANNYDFAALHRRQIFPAGTRAQRVDFMPRVSAMSAGENQKFWLKPDHFFHADVRPFGFRFHDGAASRAMHCVRERKYRSGAAPERVLEHITAARANVAEDRKFIVSRAEKLEAARNRLDGAFADLRRRLVPA